MKLSHLILALCALVMTSSAAFAEAIRLPDRAMGDPKAPVKVEEFLSMTCSHCGEFYLRTLPLVKKNYVDTGKVRLILRDFPLDGTALKVAALARCVPPEQAHAFINVVFDKMPQWMSSAGGEKTLIQYAQLAGVPPEKAAACMKDNDLLDAIAAERVSAAQKYQIQGTPAFVINGTDLVAGLHSYEEFAAILDQHIAAKK